MQARLVALGLVALVAIPGASAGGKEVTNPPAANSSDEAAYAKPSRLVTLADGRRINILCMGTGSPTVMLEAGLANDSSIWRKVQPAIARFTRVCAYDRSGYLYSDPSKRSPTAENAVDDLHQLVERAGIASPIVLVGHSLGGLYATLYADKYQPQLAGLVLVDPSVSGQFSEIAKALGPAQASLPVTSIAETKALQRSCIALAQDNEHAQLIVKCYSLLPNLSDLSPVLRAAQTADYDQAKVYDTFLGETEAFEGDGSGAETVDDRQEKAAAHSFGSLPVIVLTAGDEVFAPGLPGGANARIVRAWRAKHAQLAARSDRGRVEVVTGSGHFIQLAKPEAVIEAVREVVETSRAKPPA